MNYDCAVSISNQFHTDLEKEVKKAVCVTYLQDWLIENIKNIYPEALDIVTNDRHGVYSVASSVSLFPIFKTPIPQEHLTFHIVDAPDFLHNSRRKTECEKCNAITHHVVLSSRFICLFRHLIESALVDTYSKSSEFKDVSNTRLRKAILSFLNPQASISIYKDIPLPELWKYSKLANNIVVSGITWLLFHEFAHIYKKPQIADSALPNEFYNKSAASEEISADVSALRLLSYRLTARDPDDYESQLTLYAGTEFTLRTFSIIKAYAQGSISLRHKIKNGGNHPSHHLRLKNLKNWIDPKIKSIYPNCPPDYWKWREPIYNGWESVLNQLED